MREFLAQTHDLLLKGGAAVVGFFHGMAGGANRSAFLLALLMAADYVSGVVAAAMKKSPKTAHGRLSSEAGWKGLLRKALILVVVCFSYLLDLLVNEGNSMFFTATVWFYIGNEGLSFLENLTLCGVPVPKKLRLLLEKTANEEDGDGGAAGGGEPDGGASGKSTPGSPGAESRIPGGASESRSAGSPGAGSRIPGGASESRAPGGPRARPGQRSVPPAGGAPGPDQNG